MAGPQEVEDRDWTKYADGMEEEGTLRRDETPIKDAELNLNFLRGQQWPVRSGPASPYRSDAESYRFTLNLMAQLVKRKTALITDTRPNIDVVPTGDRRKRGAADVCKETIIGLWEEQSFDQSVSREIGPRGWPLRGAGSGAWWNPGPSFPHSSGASCPPPPTRWRR